MQHTASLRMVRFEECFICVFSMSSSLSVLKTLCFVLFLFSLVLETKRVSRIIINEFCPYGSANGYSFIHVYIFVILFIFLMECIIPNHCCDVAVICTCPPPQLHTCNYRVLKFHRGPVFWSKCFAPFPNLCWKVSISCHLFFYTIPRAMGLQSAILNEYQKRPIWQDLWNASL